MPQQEPRRSALPFVVVGILVILAVLWWGTRERQGSSTASRPAAVTQRVEDVPPVSPEKKPPSRADPAAGLPEAPELPETPWAAVDMAKVREAMPDNLYWKLSFPTKDPEILREREEERARWNVEYGKVLSNTATAEEIDAYYAQRQKISSDYVEFATYLLVEFGDALPIRDVGLLKVAVELNLARLEEIPRQIAEAHERRKAHDAARRAWLEEQKAFPGGDSR